MLPPILADVVLSSESLALVGVVVGSLWVALIASYRDRIAALRDIVRDLTKQRDELLSALYRCGGADNVPPSVPHSAIPPAPPTVGEEGE